MTIKTKPAVAAIDQSAESEITIQPDGRVFAFGITGPLADVLAAIPTADQRTKTRLEQILRLTAASCARQSQDDEELS